MTRDPASVVIRPESLEDHDAIRRLVTAAFQSEAEAVLVDRIRVSAEYIPEMALVAEADGEIVGHVMISFDPNDPTLRGAVVYPVAFDGLD